MLIDIDTKSPIHRRFVQVEAIKMGMEAEPVSETKVTLTYADPQRVLNLFKMVGWCRPVLSNRREQESTR